MKRFGSSSVVGVVSLTTLLLAVGCDDGGGAAAQGPSGDLRFGAVTLPAEGRAGHPMEISAEILSDTVKYNVTVRLRLVRSEDPSTFDPGAEEASGEWAWGTVIDELNAGEPFTVQESFDLPPGLEAGTYAAVLELDGVDFTSEDDALQGEEAADRANNVVVRRVAVTAPTLPDLEVTLVKLDRYGFDLEAPETFGAQEELFGAGVTVVARTHDVALPIAFRFELGIPDGGGGVGWYPLQVGAPGAGGEYAGPLEAFRLPPEVQLDADDVAHLVTLLANRPRSFQVGLHAPPATRAALEALSEDADCTLRVLADHEGLLLELDEANNAPEVPLTFFRSGVVDDVLEVPSAGDLTPGARAAHLLRDWRRKQSFGNATFAASYDIGAAFSLTPPDEAAVEDARNIRFTSVGTASLTLLGGDYDAVDARTIGNLDLDDPAANVFAASVDAFGTRVLSERHPFATEGDVVVLYDRLKELYSASKTKKKKFLLGGVVPMTVTGTARLSLGLRGRVTAGPDRRVTIGIGPYLDATGTTDATVNLGVASGGVTGNVRFLYVDQLYDNAAVLTDALVKQYQFGETFHLRTLDGYVYLHARTPAGCGSVGLSSCRFKKTLLDWDGYSKTYTVPIATADVAP